MFEKDLYKSIAQIQKEPESAGVDSIVKSSLVETVAAELRERLAAGRFKGLLPGVRLISRSLGVSVPTVCRALHILAEDGLLEGGGTKRRWRVKNGGTGQEAAGFPEKKTSPGGIIRKGRLLFLASLPLSSERHSGVEVFAELLDQLGTKGWEVTHRVENFASAKTPRRSWDELLRLAQPDAMVVLGGTPVLGTWAAERGIRTLFLGGDPGDSGAPVIAVRVTTMLRHALGHLLELGHRRVLMPLCGRSPGFGVNCREIAEETMIPAVHKGSIEIVETAYATPQVVVDLLRGQWRKRAPDALIFLDWREFVAASGYLAKIGIAIPKDVSVVVLSQNATMEWHMPKITHFEHPVKPMARMISKWVTEGSKPAALHGSIEVRARWVERESVAARK